MKPKYKRVNNTAKSIEKLYSSYGIKKRKYANANTNLESMLSNIKLVIANLKDAKSFVENNLSKDHILYCALNVVEYKLDKIKNDIEIQKSLLKTNHDFMNSAVKMRARKRWMRVLLNILIHPIKGMRTIRLIHNEEKRTRHEFDQHIKLIDTHFMINARKIVRLNQVIANIKSRVTWAALQTCATKGSSVAPATTKLQLAPLPSLVAVSMFSRSHHPVSLVEPVALSHSQTPDCEMSESHSESDSLLFKSSFSVNPSSKL